MVTPIVWGNVTSGIQKTDKRLLEMAHSYRFGSVKTVRRVYIPSVMPYFTAACTTGLGLAWKAGIAAEVLANTKLSIGGQIYNSKIYIETADLFAWTVVVIIMSVILEWLMMRFVKTVGRKYNVGSDGV
jgi:NitT/TauT family transport system permease protein